MNIIFGASGAPSSRGKNIIKRINYIMSTASSISSALVPDSRVDGRYRATELGALGTKWYSVSSARNARTPRRALHTTCKCNTMSMMGITKTIFFYATMMGITRKKHEEDDTEKVPRRRAALQQRSQSPHRSPRPYPNDNPLGRPPQCTEPQHQRPIEAPVAALAVAHPAQPAQPQMPPDVPSLPPAAREHGSHRAGIVLSGWASRGRSAHQQPRVSCCGKRLPAPAGRCCRDRMRVAEAATPGRRGLRRGFGGRRGE